MSLSVSLCATGACDFVPRIVLQRRTVWLFVPRIVTEAMAERKNRVSVSVISFKPLAYYFLFVPRIVTGAIAERLCGLNDNYYYH